MFCCTTTRSTSTISSIVSSRISVLQQIKQKIRIPFEKASYTSTSSRSIFTNRVQISPESNLFSRYSQHLSCQLIKFKFLSSTTTTEISEIEDTAGMNSKHLAAGSTCPPWDGKKLRIYSMRFCPYAQRALLIASAKGADLDVVNCNLVYKPEWIFEKNPQGKVPIVETKEGYLYESLVCAEYIDEVISPGQRLQQTDPFLKAQDRIWIEKFSPITGLWIKVLLVKDDEEARQKMVAEMTEILSSFEKELTRRGTTFFGGSNAGFLDYMIWPWIERIPVIKLMIPDLFDFEAAKKQNPKLDMWRTAMKGDSAVQFTIVPAEIHVQMLEKHLAGKTDYDIMAS